MSLKNRYLLNRSGRNQFGDPGEGPPPIYKPSRKQKALDDQMFNRHKQLNDAFITTHGNPWLKELSNFKKKEIWKKLCPLGRPSLSSFYTQSREFKSSNEFLEFWLISHKRGSLTILGCSNETINKMLADFVDCGRYGICYGKKKRMIFTQ